MKFYFDESGQFALPKQLGRHCASVVVGVVIPETIERELEYKYEALVHDLSPDETANGEPKGRLFSLKSRSLFCDMLAGVKGVWITPVTLDMSEIAERNVPPPVASFEAKLIEHSRKCIYPEMANHVRGLAERVGKLSTSQFWRLFTWANAFRESLHHSIIFLSNQEFEKCWETTSFEIDAVQSEKSALENTVFIDLILGWLEGWSASHPFKLIQERHTSEHEFVKRYDTEHGVDLNKLVRGRIQFVDSSTSWGLQIADIAANIVFRAVHDLKNENGDVSVFGSLARRCPYGPVRGAGHIWPGKETDAAMTRKYSAISQVMKRPTPLYL